MAVVEVLVGLVIVVGILGRFYWARRLKASHDVYFHFLAADEIRDTGHRLPEKIDYFLFDGPYDYPPGLAFVLSFLSADVRERYAWLLGPVVDTIHILILAGFTYGLTNDTTAMLVSVAVYLATPELYKHHTVLTPRSVGSLLLTGTVLSAFIAVGGNSVYYFPAVVFGAAVLLTHKMSTQTLAIIFVAFAVVNWQILYLLILGAIVIAALVFSSGHYVRIFRSHVAIINFWRIQHAKGNPSSAFFRDMGTQSKEDTRADTPFERIKDLFRRFDPLLFVASNLWVFVLPAILFWVGDLQPESEILSNIVLWALVLLVTSVSTQYVPVCKLIGEGHKYFIWSAFPTALVFGVFFAERNGTILWAGFFLVALGSLVFTQMLMRGRAEATDRVNITRRGQSAVDAIRESEYDNVMCVPPGFSFTIAYLTGKKVLWHASTTAYLEGEVYYPTPQKPLGKIANDYDIGLIVVDTERIAIDETDFELFDIRRLENGYLVLERRSSDRSPTGS